ncbi:MAG: PilZ domain-containing protein [Spirochaetaceae bacterium]|jgi:hypothetical protein|nr:PilZ domain-containing protein [Spirochaetaceae bacterium]
MKLVLVIESDETFDRVAYYTAAMGFEPIRYRQVLKSMDNLDEVDPALILISAQDFPRDWKVLLQFVRSEGPKTACPLILLKSTQFPLEATARAFYLGVNGLVAETLDEPQEITRLLALLRGLIPAQERYRFCRYFEEEWNRFGLVISHPRTQGLITGRVIVISAAGIAFYPDTLAALQDLPVEEDLPGCSLRAGEAILSPVCRIVHPGRVLILEFRSFPDHERALLETYLQGRLPC